MAGAGGSSQELRWVLRAQCGDTEAFDALLRSIQQPVFRYLASLIDDEHAAHDVLQEVFLVVVRKVYWLREPAAFRSWVYRIASRKAFEFLRRRRRSTEVAAEPASLDNLAAAPGFVSDNGELLERLGSLLNGVSPASRAVLSLHYLSGLSLQETADVLEINLGTAKSRLAYGLATLRARLAQPKTIPSNS